MLGPKSPILRFGKKKLCSRTAPILSTSNRQCEVSTAFSLPGHGPVMRIFFFYRNVEGLNGQCRGQWQAAAWASKKTKNVSEYAGSCRWSAGGSRTPLRSGRVLSSTIFNRAPFSFTHLQRRHEEFIKRAGETSSLALSVLVLRTRCPVCFWCVPQFNRDLQNLKTCWRGNSSTKARKYLKRCRTGDWRIRTGEFWGH